MSALRELAATLGGNAYKSVAVSSWGKWKTATQVHPPRQAFLRHKIEHLCTVPTGSILHTCSALHIDSSTSHREHIWL